MESKPIEMAALGRALYPGMLYDCRSDSSIPGVTLWDKASLKNDLEETWQPKTELKFSASDSASEKANFLEVNASLKASFLGGLIEVGGAAKYLHDSKSSVKQSRVTMMFSQTSKFEQLTMSLLGKVSYPQVFEQKTATHVVTATLYGAHAFMVFDHTASGAEEKQEVEGNVNAVVKKIPSLVIEGQADLKLNDEEKKLADEISVTFYGDFHLENNPMTYREALDVYKKLPSLLNRDNFGVPVKVWLYPLVLLDQEAAALVREISISLVSKTERTVEQFGEAEMRLNDLLGSRTVQDFPDLKARLQKFQDFYSDYKLVFQRALCKVLPAIRGGGQEEQALTEILGIHSQSPFTANEVSKWLDSITTESQVLSSYTKGLEDITVVTSSGQLSTILFDPDVDIVVCLTFTSLTENDEFLQNLEEFLKSKNFAKLEKDIVKTEMLTSNRPWFPFPEISQSMKENLSLFKKFSRANKGNERIQFIITSIHDSNNPGTSIYLYENGELKNRKFQPVSKPPQPIQKTSESLQLQKSPTGETVRYRVEYKQVKPADPGAKADQQEWQVRETVDAEVTFRQMGLQPEVQYLVQYRAVSEVGVSEPSEPIHFTPKTDSKIPTPIISNDAHTDCVVVGGPGGRPFSCLTGWDDMALRTIKLFMGWYCVKKIQVGLGYNQDVAFGFDDLEKLKAFEFEDGDRFRSLSIWPNSANDRLGGLKFEILRKNGQSMTFSAGVSDGGKPVSIDVHSGICCGVKGRSGIDVDAFGFVFLKG